MPGCQCKKYEKRYYNYYDTPEGCDIEKKIGVTTRYGIITGILAGTYDVLMYSHCVGLSPVLRRYALHVVPLGMMGATFAAVSNGLVKVRERDDSLNYFLGGLACGPIAAWYLGSLHALVVGGLALGMAAKVKKDAIDSCHMFFPRIPNHMNMVNSWRQDYTLAEDPRDKYKHTCGL